mgnify:CR=1 FL=1
MQKEVFDQESRNAYVSSSLCPPFALTLTGTIDNHMTEPLETWNVSPFT